MNEIILKKGRERSILNRHPWVFSGAIKINKEPADGELVLLCDEQRKPLAYAHWSKDKNLVAKIISFKPEEKIDELFFKKKFDNAFNLRKNLALPSNKTNAFRFLHAEGDEMPGLVCDIFANTASIILSNLGLKTILPLLSKYLCENFNIEQIYIYETYQSKEKNFLAKVLFLENNINFEAEIGTQKTGYFLDQRDNRQIFSKHAENKNILDVFSHFGGFSIYALKNGLAKSSTCLDSSDISLKQCQRHMELNGLKKEKLNTIKDDAFSFLRLIPKNHFDLIVLDPPAFAKNAKSVDRASRAYKDINLLALKAIKDEGLIFSFSCSQNINMDLFKKIIYAASKDSQREVRIIQELGQSSDHPVNVYCPQSYYLKGLVLYVT